MTPKRNEPSSPSAISEEESASSESIAATKEEEKEQEGSKEDSSESEPEKPQRQTREQLKGQPLSQPKHIPPPSTQVLSSESESLSDSESEPNIPLKSKPETLRSKNPKPHPPSPSKPSSLKRPTVSNDSKQLNNKRKKSSHEGRSMEDTGGATSEKKPVFQRIWSDEDETALLKGMIEFSEKKGVDPIYHMSEFFEFVKKYIKMDATQSQLVNKIRNLKDKFKNSEGKGKNSQGKGSRKPHDQELFELMRKLWSAGNDTVPEEGLKMTGTTKNKKSKGVLLKEGNMVSPKKDKDVVMDESMCVIEMSRLFPSSVDKYFLKGLELIGEKKRAELEDRWMKLRLAEMKIEEERAVLFHEQTRLLIDALNSETS